jgi:hypothetical protein
MGYVHGARTVNLGHSMINLLRSGRVILWCGSHSKIRLKMELSSGESGKIDLRNWGSFKKARKVESSADALFHGFRPQQRFTRITPRLHTSLGADA